MKLFQYLPRTIFPCHIGFTICEKSFHKEVKRLGINEKLDFIQPGNGARINSLTSKTGDVHIISTLKQSKQIHRNQFVSLLAHEAVHVSDFIFEACGENKPGLETRAYLVQFILQNCLYLYDEMTGRKK